MSDRARYICNLYWKFLLSESSVSEDLPSNSTQARYSENVPSDEMIDSEEKEISILIDNLVEKLRERKNFSSKLVEKTCVLASVLGKMFVGDQMSEEYGLLQGLYKDINFMMQLNTHEFLKGRNTVLMAFLRSIAPSKKSKLVCRINWHSSLRQYIT